MEGVATWNLSFSTVNLDRLRGDVDEDVIKR